MSDRWPRATTALLVATLGVAPLALLPMAGPIYAGMATAAPTLYTYTVAIVLAATVMALRAPRTMLAAAWAWAPLFVWLIGLTIFAWDPTPRLYSGLIHLALGAAAFAIGVGAAAEDRHGDASPTALAVPWLFAAVAWIQVLAVALALVGLPLRTLTFALAQDVNGRATGLTTHPGELSKLLFFAAMCALVLPQRTTRERWFAWSTFGAILVGVFLTQSRAALAGVVAMIGIFVGLEFVVGRWQRRHAVVVGMTAVLALASIPWIIDRFAADTGARGHTMRVAIDAIRDHPLDGVGVNSYVAVVGQTDRLTSTGVPVHNIFLLSAAEMGVIGALLLWLPIVAVSVRAGRTLRSSRGTDPAARVVVAALPGIVVMALIGWGLLQGPYFIMFALLFGYFGSRRPSAARASAEKHGPAAGAAWTEERRERSDWSDREGGAERAAGPARAKRAQRNTALRPAPPGLRSAGSEATGATREGGAERAAGPARAKRAQRNRAPMAAADVGAPARGRASLTVASGLLGLSTVATRLTTLVVMALLVRGAGPEAVGYFGLATLVASLTAAALSLGLPTYLTRQAPAGLVSPAEVARIHWARVAVLLLVAGVALPVAGGVLPPAIRFGVWLFFFASLLEQGNETAWVLIRGTRSAWAEPLTNTSAGLLLVGACAADAWLTGGLGFTDAAVYVASAAALRSLVAFAVVGIRRHLRASGPRPAGRHLRAALPYFAADVLGLFYFRGDVILLALFVAAAEVGRYVSAAALIGPAVQVAASMGIGALAYAAPRLLAGAGTGPGGADDPGSIVRFFTVSGQAVAGLMFLALPVAVAVLFGGGAVSAGSAGAGDEILALAMVLGLFLALRFTNFGLSAILLARGRADRRLAVLVVSIAGNVALNVALDPRFGAFGAAWATVATEVIVAASLLWSIRMRGLARPAVWAFAVVAAAGAAMAVLLRVGADHAGGAFAAGAVLLAVAVASALLRRRGSRPSPIRNAETGPKAGPETGAETEAA